MSSSDGTLAHVPNPSDDDDDTALIRTWLQGIGLDYLETTLEAAGIVTVAALAELPVQHFGALGITTADDRRKLFYLIQRIKMAVPPGPNRRTSSVVVSASANVGVSGSSGSTNGNHHYHHHDTHESVAPPVSSVRDNPNEASPTPLRKDPRNDRRHPTTTNPPVASPTRRIYTNNKPLVLDESSDDPDYDDDDEDYVDDEQENDTEEESQEAAPSPESTGTLPDEPRERQEYDGAIDGSRSPTGGVNADDERSRSQTHDPVTTTTRRSPQARCIHPRTSRTLRRHSESLSFGSDSNDLHRPNSIHHDTTRERDTNPTLRRVSGVPVPNSRPSSKITMNAGATNATNPSKSLRTGKQLSSIPARAVAPMSPLVALDDSSGLLADTVPTLTASLPLHQPRLSLSALDADSDAGPSVRSSGSSTSATRQRQSRGPQPPRRNRHSRAGATDRPQTLEVGSNDVHSEKVSTAVAGPEQSSSRVREGGRRRQSASTIAAPRNTSSSTRGTLRNESSSPTRHSERPEPRVSYHQGRTVDQSFAAQIIRLRRDDQADHDLFFGQDNASLDADYNELEDMRIRVVVRKRPMARTESSAAGDADIVHALHCGSFGKILCYQPKTKVDLTKSIETVPFCFDNVFDEHATNVHVYERAVRGLIPALLDGQWCSIFAYGQTGSGKTFTMMGSNVTGNSGGKEQHRPSKNASNFGLYYMSALDIFAALNSPSLSHLSVGLSCFEIYAGKLFDLLSIPAGRNAIKCLEDGDGQVCFPGLSEHDVDDPDALLSLMERAATQRSTGTTSRNADSSRSHAIVQLHLRYNELCDDDDMLGTEFSRLTLIDLAGSERGADTNSASRATRMEGAEINTSLLALKEVIRAMGQGCDVHVPFRGSKLTQVLKESLVGKHCRSVMIACIAPNMGNCEQTLNTLRYADRVKSRNPETGECSIIAEPSRGSSNRNKGSKRGVTLDVNGGSPPKAPSGQDLSRNSSFASQTSNLLDELLASPTRNEGAEVFFVDATEATRLAAAEVVACHKAAMTTLLNVIKDEMTLVNQTDADRDGLDDYIAQLVNVQDQQLDILASVRSKIESYRRTQANASGNVHHDESFDDLRS